MARDFVAVDRGQLLSMPPSLAEWLLEDHLVWTVLGAVEVMDLSRFNDAYRLGAAGRPAYDPQMMVALLMYAYARGNRSSRGIERACQEDVAFKVITSMHTPDHSTIAEFRRRHETEIAELFDDVLGLCREAGLVSVGVITIDGTKIKRTRRWIRTGPTAGWSRTSCAKPRRPTGARTSSTATIAGMSCPSSCAHRRPAARHWRTRSVSWLSAKAAQQMTRPSPNRRTWRCLGDRRAQSSCSASRRPD